MDGAPDARRELISEPFEPGRGSFEPAGASAGEPAWPRRFSWRGRAYEVSVFERTWKSTDAGHRPRGNVYLRRHWADVLTCCGVRLRLYVERGGRRRRWFVHSRLR